MGAALVNGLLPAIRRQLLHGTWPCPSSRTKHNTRLYLRGTRSPHTKSKLTFINSMIVMQMLPLTIFYLVFIFYGHARFSIIHVFLWCNLCTALVCLLFSGPDWALSGIVRRWVQPFVLIAAIFIELGAIIGLYGAIT